jgi:hypothetical protein
MLKIETIKIFIYLDDLNLLQQKINCALLFIFYNSMLNNKMKQHELITINKRFDSNKTEKKNNNKRKN